MSHPFLNERHKQYNIIDERCKCGHLRSEHGILTTFITGGIHPENLPVEETSGAGACRGKTYAKCYEGLACVCPQFTWTANVFGAV